MSGVAPGAAQITICGTLNRDTIAALVEVAMTAGAALLVQPRTLPASDVVEASPPVTRRAPALPPAKQPRAARQPRRVAARAKVAPAPSAAEVPIDERLARALKGGPLRLAELRAKTGLKLTAYSVQVLVKRGALVATGATVSRRYALPGTSAKEAP